jgi:EmrB/QacA subfamily drug resistance transporter
MMTTSAPIVIEAFSLRERGRAMAVYSTIPIAFISIGPLIGGALTEFASWRYVFWINLPVAIIALVLTWIARPNNARFPAKHFDVPGAVLLVVGLVAFVLGLQEASTWGWGSPATIGAIAGGLILLALFVRTELRTDEPVVELRLFRGRAFAGDNAILFCVQLAMIASTTFSAIYLQTVLGFSPIEAGVALVPLILPILIVKGYVGRLFDRVGVRPPVRVGTVMVAISFLVLAPAIAAESFALMLPGLVLQGFGIAFVMSPSNTDALSRAPARLRGAASGTVNTSRQLGGTIGLAAIGTVIATIEASQLSGGANTADAASTATAIGYLVAAGAMVIAALVAFFVLPAGRQEDDDTSPPSEPAEHAESAEPAKPVTAAG